ncbi:MAG TPA: phenylalanine--tRNA ligase subunit beta [Caldisericia bacterium]|nr:phenylalanine--tRNA ligase subunit beta [Caldisericia bacterium]
MIISYAFLKSILKDSCPTAEDLGHKLTHIGFEVDSIDHPIEQKAMVVEVEDSAPISFEDKTLYLVNISDGTQKYQVLTSWPELRPGNKVVYAKPGQTIADQRIDKKVFGEYVSHGMLLSWSELKLSGECLSSSEKNGLLVLPEDTPIGEDFYKLFFLDEPFFHIKVPYNRPDCLSFLGLFREILTAYRISFPTTARRDIHILFPTFHEKQLHRTVAHTAFKGISLEDKEKCPYYTGAIIENVHIGPSIFEIRQRLFAFQLKPVSNAVDAVNLLMMYFGHPLHTFDLDRVTGKHVIVRSAKNGESIEALDNKTISLDDEDLVIADEIRPIALAGVIGGKDTEITSQTTNIFIESAFFNPIAISHTSEKYHYHTDASSRFSRGADLLQVKDIMGYASQLISVLCNGTIAGESYSVGSNEYHPLEIQYSLSDFTRMTGLDITKYSATQILQFLEIPFEIKLQDQLLIKVPSFRMNDLKESVDISEDLLRFIGYDKIVPKKPCFHVHYAPENPRIKTEQWIKTVLMGQGFFEIITDSFVPDEVLSLGYRLDSETLIKVANPLRSGWQYLSPDKLFNMMQVIKNNYSRKITELRLFEIGKHYTSEAEDLYLNLALSSSNEKSHWLGSKEKVIDFFYIKGIIEGLFQRLGIPYEQKKNLQQHLFNPDQSVDFYLDNYLIASAGLIQKNISNYFDIPQEIYYAKCKFSYLIKYLNREPQYEAISYLQEITRDLCVFVPQDIKAGDMIHRIHHVAGKALKKVSVFDLYEGATASAPENHKSIALRLHFIFHNNISKEKIQELVNTIIDELMLAFHAVLRK